MGTGSTGGAAQGGTGGATPAAGGSANASGNATGGVATGGFGTGNVSAGGTSASGGSTGGASSGGQATGGLGTGGVSAGGTSAGGGSTGGSSSGGQATGGTVPQTGGTGNPSGGTAGNAGAQPVGGAVGNAGGQPAGGAAGSQGGTSPGGGGTDYWDVNFTTSKEFTHHFRQSFNFGWRFLQGNGTGNPAEANYDDSGWDEVNVPHSPSYDAPESSDFYLGPAWYRKTFTLPPGDWTGKKIFIEFGGAMSTAQVWVNGTLAGSHGTNGYTSFVIDITDQVSTTASNVIAVNVDNSLQEDVPPGAGWVDYVTWGGIYRNTWLHISDPVYIPQWGQIISTPTVATGSATVQVNTTVNNDSAQQASCSVTYTV